MAVFSSSSPFLSNNNADALSHSTTDKPVVEEGRHYLSLDYVGNMLRELWEQLHNHAGTCQQHMPTYSFFLDSSPSPSQTLSTSLSPSPSEE